MSDDHPRLDTGQIDTSPHDQTPDVSLDTAMSIREAATQANVTEKTIRRWIKSGRLHAIKLGGQYRITVADLETARAAGDVHDVQITSTQRPDTGQDSPLVDMSSRLDSGHGGHGQGGQANAPVDLAPLTDLIERQAQELQRLTETATMWQFRARQLEDQLKQLTAGEPVPQTVPEAPRSPESNETGPRGLLARVRRWIGR